MAVRGGKGRGLRYHRTQAAGAIPKCRGTVTGGGLFVCLDRNMVNAAPRAQLSAHSGGIGQELTEGWVQLEGGGEIQRRDGDGDGAVPRQGPDGVQGVGEGIGEGARVRRARVKRRFLLRRGRHLPATGSRRQVGKWGLTTHSSQSIPEGEAGGITPTINFDLIFVVWRTLCVSELWTASRFKSHRINYP